MKKLALRVSGARVGDAARPAASKLAVPVRSKQLGLRVHSTSVAGKPIAASSIAAEDYATLDDYEVTR